MDEELDLLLRRSCHDANRGDDDEYENSY